MFLECDFHKNCLMIVPVFRGVPIMCRFANGLTGIKEKEKFQKNGKSQDQVPGLKHLVGEAKTHHNVKYVKQSSSHVLCMTEVLIHDLSSTSRVLLAFDCMRSTY